MQIYLRNNDEECVMKRREIRGITCKKEQVRVKRWVMIQKGFKIEVMVSNKYY